jgi:hypothetical protein
VYVRDDSNVVVKQVPVFGELSAAFLINWDEATATIDPYELYKSGVALNQFLIELTESNQFVSDERFFDRRKYTKPLRASMMFDFVRNHHPMEALLKQEIGMAPYTKIFRWPNDVGFSPWLNKIELALNFERSLSAKGQCGYVREFFYAPCVEVDDLHSSRALDKIYRPGDYFMFDKDKVELSYTYQTYAQLLKDVQGNNLRARLEAAKKDRKAVAFKLPIRFSVKEFGLEVPVDKPFLTWQPSTTIVSIAEGLFQYRWNEVYINEESNDLALSQTPAWLISQDGMEYVEVSTMLGENVDQLVYLRDGFKLYNDFSWARTF